MGTEDFDVVNGQVSRTSEGSVSAAGCRIEVDDELTFTASVGLAAEGYERDGFEKRLNRDGYDQLPPDVGLGFTWADEQDRGGDSVSTGQAWVSYGDYFVRVWIAGIADGRDQEADAAAIAAQLRQTLDIPEQWTLPGSPPTR
ncbi:hypothetical protein [Haloactinopolyspora alba]|nr:hypothetical protein [Haloactinopolyspora alba]